MDQDKTVKKLLLNIKEFNLDVTTALTQAYAAGYDERDREVSKHGCRAIGLFTRDDKMIGSWPSQKEAARKNKTTQEGINYLMRHNRPTKRGHFWKYIDNGASKNIL